jgi:hypothetical protein
MPDELEKVVRVEQAKTAGPPLVLDDWDYQFFKGTLSQYFYAITLTLRNTETKQIKLVDASVAFSDLLDQHMYAIKISPDQTIAPGQRHTVLGDYPVNEFISDQLRMKDLKKADIKARLTVRRVVFSDNTVLEVKP